MIALDTETPGKDFKKGNCLPFFVTTHTGKPNDPPKYWEWSVDPLTRRPRIPKGAVEEIGDYLFSSGPHGPIGQRGLPDSGLVIQNAKFDIMALNTIGLWDHWDLREVWNDVHDILIGAHLLGSNRPKDLTTLALHFLNVNIEPLEKAVEAATKDARQFVRSKHFRERYGDWAIAKDDRDDMPSAKGDRIWKNDMWLPRALVTEIGLDAIQEYMEEDCSHWECVTRNYSNADSVTAAAVWKRIYHEMGQRNLLKIYECRRKLVRIVYDMEDRGITISEDRLEELEINFKEDTEKCARICTNIAESYGHKLDLPKSGVNNNLRTFMFDVLKVEHRMGKKSKTDAPTLDKDAMQHYLVTLPQKSKPLLFVQKLLAKRSRDTALQFMNAYRRFWVPHCTAPRFNVLHPSLNIVATDTLRFGSSNPNEQNIGKNGIDIECNKCRGEGCGNCKDTGRIASNLRYTFGPIPGREQVSLDAKNIEARLPAYKSCEQELIELYERPDDPPYYGSAHLLNFHTIYTDIWDAALKTAYWEWKDKHEGKKVDISLVGPYVKKKYAATWYQYCKNGGFAVQYGAIERADGTGTADKAFHRPFSHRKLKQRFSKLEALNQWCIDCANKNGYVETMPDRSVDPDRGYPLLCTRTDYGRVLETVPLNYYIQGTAMWWTAKAMIRVEEFFSRLNDGEEFDGRTWCGGYYLVMQVHDELVIEMPTGPANAGEKPWDYNMPIVREVARLMELGGEDIGIPTPVGVEYHAETWGEGITLSL